jgi:mono/diheme cytochrome c family protein
MISSSSTMDTGGTMHHRTSGFILAGAVALLGSLIWSAPNASAHEDASKPEYYTTKVKPIFDANCARCHSGMNHRGGLNIDTKESLLKGGHTGPAIVPGDPAKSLLVTLIRHEGPASDPMPMPPKGDKLSDADIATVTAWIKAGAIMPATPAQ